MLLEVLIFFFSQINREITNEEHETFIQNYITLCQEDKDFQKTINTTTKSMENYRIRYSKFYDLMRACFININFNNPFGFK